MMRQLTLDSLPRKVLSRLDLETAFMASRSVLAAESLLVFRKLNGKELSSAQVGSRTGINHKYCEPFLDFLVFLGLLKKKSGLYRNSPLADKYFIRARSIDWTRLWSDECIKDYKALSVMEEVLTSGKGWQKVSGIERKTDYELARQDRQWARGFTYALYDLYKPNAEILAKHLDLSGFHSLLDVGGGSGVISFALVRANPHLKACILDFQFVCDAADEIIRREHLARRVRTLAGDMNRSIPRGFDVIMFWNVGYIDSQVIKMAYNRLPEGGMIVRDCFPPSKSKAPSLSRFISRYLSVRPRQQSRDSIISSLKKAGFRSVKYRRISGNIGLITGLKRQRRKQAFGNVRIIDE